MATYFLDLFAGIGGFALGAGRKAIRDEKRKKSKNSKEPKPSC